MRLLRISLLVLASFILLTGLAACGSDDSATGVHVAVNYEEAKALIDGGGVKVLDVRTAEEYATGHIAVATLLPLQELKSRLDELDKDEVYLLVCRSGNRSGQAQKILKDAGFTKTYNMRGGMNEWPYEVVK